MLADEHLLPVFGSTAKDVRTLPLERESQARRAPAAGRVSGHHCCHTSVQVLALTVMSFAFLTTSPLKSVGFQSPLMK